MKYYFFLLSLVFICCNNEKAKSYTSQHQSALAYCKEHQMNEDYYFLVDLSLHSGKNRFFVYDFKKGKVMDKNLVTHGACDVFETNVKKYAKAKFDARQDSHCSMKGKFKIGKRDYSSWGINVKYWLHGLEPHNKTAVDRVVVLHSWTKVANVETYPVYAPLSWGCPAVSDAFMRKLDTRLQASTKPVLLWIME